LDVILLRDNSCGAQPELRTTATAVLSAVQRLTEASPVLLAVDDLQWLDPASANILPFVTRRLSGPVGVLTTVRTDAGSSCATAELDLARVSEMQRITVAPMTLGALHDMLRKRLGRSFSRPTLVRIHETSGGNPSYALELARAMDDPTTVDTAILPGALVDVVRTRAGSLDADVQEALLAAAAMSSPTVALVAHALDAAPADAIGLLERAEDAGIVRIDGHRVHFAHPLLARGVYSGASPAHRRRVHRRVAEGIVDPELRARHLALGSAIADPRLVRLLDSAAESARLRGAQATAAELLDLAVGLGGDTPTRRIRSAARHFAAGDVRRARTVLEQSMTCFKPGAPRARALGLLAGIHLFDDSFTAAGELLRQGLAESEQLSSARVQLLIAQAFTQVNTGDADAAVGSIDRAVADATTLRVAALLSQALGLRQVLALLRGDGLDESAMQRAVGLDDRRTDTPIPFRATMNHVLLQAWSGQLEPARADLSELRRRCQERGDEHEQLYIGFHGASIEIWRADFHAASELAREATERAEQLGGDIPLAMAAATQAWLDAYAGRVQDARRRGRAALEASRRCGCDALARSAIASLAFVESSLGEHSAVAALVEPLLEADAARPRATELATAAYLPDAAEALINLGRLDEAEVLIERLERNGRRLDRAWMLAVGGRCRAMLSAARGDTDTATEIVEQAMAHHDRLPMPFERARTQLLLGQLHRRQRRKHDAAEALDIALSSFEALNTPLWAERTRAELARATPTARNGAALTPSERAVAELAGTGMNNRDVAASLYISPKTVEATLTRVYRKLNIRSRAELGRYTAQFDKEAS
jgi:DNA-binding CsgD family transcriptional regulator